VTESENHPNWRSASEEAGSLVDTGGDFTTERRYVAYPREGVGSQVVTSGPYLNSVNQIQTDTLRGAILPLFPFSMPFPNSARSSDIALAALGTTAIANCAPTNNVASLATSLLELYHEGLPRMLGASKWQERARTVRDVYKASGDEYLNVQFGWKPLVQDVSDTAYGIIRFHSLMEQAERDSGKVVRRRYDLPSISTIREDEVASGVSPKMIANTDFTSVHVFRDRNQGKVTRIREVTKKRWFSGAFTYHLPNLGGGLLEQLDQARRVFGLTPDPEVLWNLTPWSWAIDWFSNVGDVIHNVNAMVQYGLVLRYGYVMEHSIATDTYVFSGPTGYKSAGVTPLDCSLVTETKLRRGATPFGFGLELNALNGTQKAIMAALGMSRA